MFKTPSETLVLGTLLLIAALVLLACGLAEVAMVAGIGALVLSAVDLLAWLRARHKSRKE